jgi:hypothetical protein
MITTEQLILDSKKTELINEEKEEINMYLEKHNNFSNQSRIYGSLIDNCIISNNIWLITKLMDRTLITLTADSGYWKYCMKKILRDENIEFFKIWVELQGDNLTQNIYLGYIVDYQSHRIIWSCINTLKITHLTYLMNHENFEYDPKNTISLINRMIINFIKNDYYLTLYNNKFYETIKLLMTTPILDFTIVDLLEAMCNHQKRPDISKSQLKILRKITACFLERKEIVLRSTLVQIRNMVENGFVELNGVDPTVYISELPSINIKLEKMKKLLMSIYKIRKEKELVVMRNKNMNTDQLSIVKKFQYD